MKYLVILFTATSSLWFTNWTENQSVNLIFYYCCIFRFLIKFFSFRLTVNPNSFLAPRNKTVNLDVLNVSTDSLPPKKDNLGSLKNLNIANEGTLQKIKKTYIWTVFKFQCYRQYILFLFRTNSSDFVLCSDKLVTKIWQYELW